MLTQRIATSALTGLLVGGLAIAAACSSDDDDLAPSTGVCETSTMPFARSPWSEPHVEPPVRTEREAPSGVPERYAFWWDNPPTAGSNLATYWLTDDEDFVQSYTVILGVDWPHVGNVMQIGYLLDGVRVPSEIDGVTRTVHDVPIPADNRVDFTVRIDHGLFTDGAHSLDIQGHPYPTRALDGTLLPLTVFKNGVEFPPFVALPAELLPRDDSWTATRTEFHSEAGVPDGDRRLMPSPDGSFDVSLVVEPIDDDSQFCPGEPTVPLGVIALLDREQVPFADGSLVLRFEPRWSQRALATTRIEGLPLDAGHRIDLVMLGGLNRPTDTPSGEYSAWYGGTNRLAVVGW